MKNYFPKPFKNAIIYRDDKLYACLANKPIVRGHVVVIWNKPVKDLHLLSRPDYEYLMDRVNDIRRAMMKTLKVKKVYLLYMDEISHVHWHLIPRYNKSGIQNLTGRPGKIKDFTLDDKIRKNLIITART
jgi:diadenosine tetraphosphate (Ap4A) HIT family hydrolase